MKKKKKKEMKFQPAAIYRTRLEAETIVLRYQLQTEMKTVVAYKSNCVY